MTRTRTSTESPMLVTAHAGWAGCKRRIAPVIVGLLGPHDLYCEPFLGGGAVFYAKPPCRLEILNDLHGDLINLVRIIADRQWGPLLYRRLRRTVFCQSLHQEAQARLREETDPLERAYCYFVQIWMGWGGIAGTRRAGSQISIRYTNNGGASHKRFAAAVDSVPAWRRRLRGVTILNTDAFDLIGNLEDAPGTCLYVDPPYPDNHVNYDHEFPSLDDERRAQAAGDNSVKGHIALAELLNRFRKARVIVSYYGCPMLAELYPDWALREIEVTKSIAQIAKRESRRQRVTEVLLINQPGTQGSLFE